MKKYGFSLFAITLIFTAQANAASFYVSPNGNDAHAGTEAAPFATIAKARDAVKALGTLTTDANVYLRGGWYVLTDPLTFDSTNSGSGRYKIVYQAYSGEYPVISSGKRITDWKLHNAVMNIWKAAAPPGIGNRQLYIDCVRAVRAHSGGGLPGVVRSSTGYTTTDTTMQNWGNIDDIEFVYNAMLGGTGGDGSGRPAWAAQWTERRVGVATISGTTITMDSTAWNYAALVQSPDQNQMVSKPTDIENAYELLDQPGEWYLDGSAGVVYYIPRTGETLAAVVIAPVLETLVACNGSVSAPVANITFKGITFAHTTWLRPNTEGFPELQANHCIGYGWPPAGVSVTAGRNILFEGCVFKHLGGIGLDLSGGSQDCMVRGCLFTDISGNCIKVGTITDAVRSDTRARDTGIIIANNYIHDAPCEYRGGVGIFAGYVEKLLVWHNFIAYTPYTALSCGMGWGIPSYLKNNCFNGNKFDHFCQSLGDGGGIYTLNSQPGTVWEYNWFNSMPWRENGGAMYTDDTSGDMEIHHNVCTNIGNSWLHLWIESIHNVNVHDIWTNTDKFSNVGVNCPVTNVTVVTGTAWPKAARDIMDNAGIQPAFASTLTLACACSLSQPPAIPDPEKTAAMKQ